jgi:membrane-associated PAP2 superfamily phosphatase
MSRLAARHHRPLAGLLLGLVAVLAWDISALDIALAHVFGSVNGFPAREAFWSRDLLHTGMHDLWIVTWLVLTVDALRRRPAASGPSRRDRRLALVAGLLVLLIVPALKGLSHTSCPWSLQDFGSTSPWVSHWDWTLRDGGPGHCFPSGHTAGAAAFAPFAWLWGRRGWMLLGLSIALASFGQMARGAHFLSHSLWAAWIGIALGWVLLQALRGRAWKTTPAPAGELTAS